MESEKEEYLKQLLESYDGIKILSEKLETIILDKEFYKWGLLNEIVEKLISNGFEEIILNNFTVLLDSALNEEIFDIINQISNLSNGKKLIFENIKKIYSKLDGEEIPELIELLENEEKEKIINRNIYAYKLYNDGLIRESSLGSIIKSDMSIFVEAIIKEVSNGKLLNKLDSGTFCDCILTNEYVIKIGETREKYEIPYHPNILQPLLREKIVDENGKQILVIEVQNKVNTKNVTDEQRKKLKEKLEESKIKSYDNYGDNVGILLKPNKRVLYNGVGGIIDYDDIKEETIEAGEPVILDTDLLEK